LNLPVSFTLPVSRHSQAMLATALCVLAAALVAGRPHWVTLPVALLSAGIFVVALVPGILYVGCPAARPIPFLPLVGLYYAVFWGLPVFLIRHETWSPPGYDGAVGDVSAAALATVLGGVTAMLGCFLIARLSICRAVPAIRLPAAYADRGLVVLLWILLLGHLAYFFLQPLHRVPSIGQFLQPVGYLSYGMFYISWKEGKIPRWQPVTVLLFIFPAEIVGMFLNGLLTPVVLILVFLYCIRIYATRKVAILPLVIAPVLIVAAYGVLPTFRQLTWFPQSGEAGGTVGKLDRLRYSAWKSIDHLLGLSSGRPGTTFVARVVVPLIERVSHTAKFAYVFEKTPGEVPYWRGVTYKPLATSFIPRALWPGKPEERLGQAFGHRYDILDPGDTVTSENVPWLTEFYVNFGVAGVALGMGLVGSFLAALETLFNNPRMTAPEGVIGATILFPLFYQESNLSLMTGSILPLTLSLLVFFHAGLRLFAWFGDQACLGTTKPRAQARSP